MANLRRRRQAMASSTPETTTTTTRSSTSVSPSATPNAAETQVASTAAGLVSRAALHPIDVVKTRLQHLRGRRGSVRPARAVVRFVAAEGLPGLYRGVAGALVGVVPHSLLYMPTYEAAQHVFGRVLGARDLGGARHLAAGALAGLAGSIVKVPVDLVKKRVQAGLHPDIFSAARAIARSGTAAVAAASTATTAAATTNTTAATALTSAATNSINSAATPALLRPSLLLAPLRAVRPFYVGWGGAMVYGVPYNAIQFLVLERVRAAARRVAARRRRALTAVDNVIVGAVTGVITSLATEPLDVVKTRLMTQRAPHAAASTGETVYNSWVHCVRVMLREEGPAALWKGTLPRLVWVAASSAIWYGTYQTARQSLAQRRVRRAQKKE